MADVPPAVLLATAPPEPERKASGRAVAAILVATIGFGFATLMVPLVGLPVFIERLDPVNKAGSLGLALGLAAVAVLICTPIFGALSDQTTGRFGMRRPGLVGGTLFVFTGLVVQGLATSTGLLMLGVVIMSIGQGMFVGSYAALVPDHVSATRRGRVLGFQSLIVVLSGVAAAFIGARLLDHQLALFGTGGLLMLVTTASAVVLLPDRVLEKYAEHGRPAIGSLLAGFRYSPKSAPNFSWVWLSRFVMTLAYTFGGFSIYFMTDELGVTDAQLPGLITLSVIVNLAGTVTGTLLGGFLSDKLARLPKLVIITSVIFAGGGLIAAASTSIPVFMVALGAIAFATGAFLPIDGALVMAVLPGQRAEIGKYMSIIAIAEQLPRAIGPLLVPAIVAASAIFSLGGYRVTYVLLGIVAITGGLVVRNVKNIE
ncbi:MAG: MFS transporter [Chloroflexota bacterium]